MMAVVNKSGTIAGQNGNIEKGVKPQYDLTPCFYLAGRPGFEPGFTESESVVLPLNDLPAVCVNDSYHSKGETASHSQ